jgi:hypothetical protein
MALAMNKTARRSLQQQRPLTTKQALGDFRRTDAGQHQSRQTTVTWGGGSQRFGPCGALLLLLLLIRTVIIIRNCFCN